MNIVGLAQAREGAVQGNVVERIGVAGAGEALQLLAKCDDRLALDGRGRRDPRSHGVRDMERDLLIDGGIVGTKRDDACGELVDTVQDHVLDPSHRKRLHVAFITTM